MALVEVNDSNFKSETSGGLVLIDCWAEWCGPCRMVAPVLEELSNEMNGAVKIKKLNVDDNQDTAQSLGISSIPTLLLYKDGQLVDKVIGALPKAQIKNFIERHK
ncbi:thioredoxin [Leptospira santarosai]|uniref:Thioredoxin n=2 Tax=Leptospira santarosai TaxID=28183 RepID=M6UJA0_9LEPT|nr:thioredoxin [Leptospira santarosai]EKS07460.1 thioredoxin [Leptospira santarosai str. JET]EMF89376.1 thioredoxin [Leptospira santarosai str. ST188]EMJ50466.1 thioredoxin [Leptospira santarosai str. HAI1349]EMN21050.1 thioredoxin [Leptospira santarosai serovar Arenal str. MAVJ 401]EMO21209.1 thioredoxin [Leptospira santarosai str. HAI134]